MKIKSGFKEKFAIGVISAIVLVYSVYHAVGLFSEDISTYAAGLTSESTVVSGNGYIFRDEKVLSSAYGGAVDYKVSDGSKVSEGQTVAVTYSQGAEYRKRLKTIDGSIRVLEQSLSAANGENKDIVSEKAGVDDSYDALIKLLSAGETGGLSYGKDKLLVGLNNVAAISGDTSVSVEQTLKKLYAEREETFKKCGGSQSCAVEKNGYFFSGVDGCESEFTEKALEDITVDKFDRLVEASGKAAAKSGDYGKVTDNSEWSIVLSVSTEDAKHFKDKEGSTYGALFAENNRVEMPLYLEKIVEDKESGRALLVFSCDRQPEGFSFDRCQSISITVNSVSGLYVPKSVVKRVDSERGVYILRGSIVYFRHIRIVYTGSDYYLVAADQEHEDEKLYLRPNDMIILNGRNLFDGRVLD